jgi:GT2 family glycosyltransferase
MTAGKGRTSVIVVTHGHRTYLADCVRALEQSAPPGTRLILVDNASTDGTVDFVRSEILAADGATTKGGLPVIFIASNRNLGFAGGNNLGLRLAVKDGDEFAYLLNPDTEAQPGFLEAARRVLDKRLDAGIVQSQLRLHPDTERLNSWGNEIHFLGFGYAGGESIPADSFEARSHLVVRDIAYASGAGMMIRTRCLRDVGGLDSELFAYHEDLEFSWRARMAGWRVLLAPESVVWHKYEFSRSLKKWYWMERNRFLVMAWLYSIPTLILLAPALFATELALWPLAFKGGWWREKLRAYAYVLDLRRWPGFIRTRRFKQSRRRVSDREATSLFTGVITFERMASPVVTFGNAVLAVYWHLARLFIFW